MNGRVLRDRRVGRHRRVGRLRGVPLRPAIEGRRRVSIARVSVSGRRRHEGRGHVPAHRRTAHGRAPLLRRREPGRGLQLLWWLLLLLVMLRGHARAPLLMLLLRRLVVLRRRSAPHLRRMVNGRHVSLLVLLRRLLMMLLLLLLLLRRRRRRSLAIAVACQSHTTEQKQKSAPERFAGCHTRSGERRAQRSMLRASRVRERGRTSRVGASLELVDEALVLVVQLVLTPPSKRSGDTGRQGNASVRAASKQASASGQS